MASPCVPEAEPVPKPAPAAEYKEEGEAGPVTPAKLGVIGGSSFLKSPFFASFRARVVETPFGGAVLRESEDGSVFFVQVSKIVLQHRSSPASCLSVVVLRDTRLGPTRSTRHRT